MTCLNVTFRAKMTPQCLCAKISLRAIAYCANVTLRAYLNPTPKLLNM